MRLKRLSLLITSLFCSTLISFYGCFSQDPVGSQLNVSTEQTKDIKDISNSFSGQKLPTFKIASNLLSAQEQEGALFKKSNVSKISNFFNDDVQCEPLLFPEFGSSQNWKNNFTGENATTCDLFMGFPVKGSVNFSELDSGVQSSYDLSLMFKFPNFVTLMAWAFDTNKSSYTNFTKKMLDSLKVDPTANGEISDSLKMIFDKYGFEYILFGFEVQETGKITSSINNIDCQFTDLKMVMNDTLFSLKSKVTFMNGKYESSIDYALKDSTGQGFWSPENSSNLMADSSQQSSNASISRAMIIDKSNSSLVGYLVVKADGSLEIQDSNGTLLK